MPARPEGSRVDARRQEIESARSAYARALDEAVERIRRTLEAMPEVHRVVLFGSYARGRRDLFTDLDLLVVMDSDEEFVSRSARLRQRLAAGVDMDLLVYNPREFERMRHRGFVRRALETGRTLLAR
jgi:predicted nucleotidyltransferase